VDEAGIVKLESVCGVAIVLKTGDMVPSAGMALIVEPTTACVLKGDETGAAVFSTGMALLVEATTVCVLKGDEPVDTVASTGMALLTDPATDCVLERDEAALGTEGNGPTGES